MHEKFPSLQANFQKASIFSVKISITWNFTILAKHTRKISVYAWETSIYVGKFSKTSIFSGKFSMNFLIFLEIFPSWFYYKTSVVK
jgi:hypothetical protein